MQNFKLVLWDWYGTLVTYKTPVKWIPSESSEDLLNYFKNNGVITQGIISNTARPLTSKLLEFGWGEYFSHNGNINIIISGEQSKNEPKPSTEMYTKLMYSMFNDAHPPKNQILFVGDMRSDFEMANRAGIEFMYIWELLEYYKNLPAPA